MSAETVTLKIEEKAKESAEIILKEAKAEGEKKYLELLEEAKAREKKILDTAKQNADTLKRGILQGASQKAKLDELKIKRSLMEEAKGLALTKLLASGDDKLLEIFKNQLKSSSLSGSFTLIPSQLHRKMLEKNIAAFEKAADIKIEISKENANLSSGFILSSDVYDVDFSLEAIVEELFTISEKVIYDTLFESGEAK